MQTEDNQLARLGASLRRRRWPFGLVFVLGIVTAVLVALLWPALYRSTATIYVEPPDVPAEVTEAEDVPERQIARVTQRVMTTENLAPLLRETGLYGDLGLSLIERVSLLQQHFTLDTVSAQSVDARGRPTETVVTFSLSFDDPEPPRAQNVLNRLVTLYLRENADIRRARFAERSRFLASEATKIAEQIEELEQRLARFQASNEGALPGSYQSNAQLLQRAESERLETDRRLAALEERMIYLRAELTKLEANPPGNPVRSALTPREQLLAAEAELRTLTGRYGDNHPDVLAVRRQVDALREALESGAVAGETEALAAARAELAAARERYTDNHPEVGRLERVVETLEEQAADGLERIVSPAEVQLRADLASAEAQARSLARAREEQTRRIAALEAAISRLPEVELNYSAITRDLENLRGQYRSIKDQELSARVALEVEAQRRGQRFVLIEEPSLPEAPHSPNRGAILFLGAVLTLGLAVLVVALLEALDTRVRGRTGVADVLGAPPLAAIPVIGRSPRPAAGRRG